MSGTGSADKCWPEPPDVTIETTNVSLGDDGVEFVQGEFNPVAGTSVYALPSTPVAGSLIWARNGVVQSTPGDYALSADTITIVTPSVAGEKFRYHYLEVSA